MCMMSAPPSRVSVDKPEIAPSGKGITDSNPLLQTNKTSKVRSKRVRKSLRINKPKPS